MYSLTTVAAKCYVMVFLNSGETGLRGGFMVFLNSDLGNMNCLRLHKDLNAFMPDAVMKAPSTHSYVF